MLGWNAVTQTILFDKQGIARMGACMQCLAMYRAMGMRGQQMGMRGQQVTARVLYIRQW